ncbi:unnamed protein product [Cylicostephanus goldi]|uniref:STPR domain-containing protein n=1 Tax=Cylicostephanus goldi TaxID=71465 RepID=A0A3P6RZY2_CYLGO|nr:unnamed protein product [Cylicostephanus goldi]
MALHRRNEPADKRKKRLADNAENTRLKRMKETEEQRTERLAKNAERARIRRSAETVEQRSLRLRASADARRNRRMHYLDQSNNEGSSADARVEDPEDSTMGLSSDVVLHSATSVAAFTEDASTTSFSRVDAEVVHNIGEVAVQIDPTKDGNYQRSVSVSETHLDDSAILRNDFDPTSSMSAEMPFGKLAVRDSYDEYAPTPPTALGVNWNGSSESNLDTATVQNVVPFEYGCLNEFENMEHLSNCSCIVSATTMEQSAIQVR